VLAYAESIPYSAPRLHRKVVFGFFLWSVHPLSRTRQVLLALLASASGGAGPLLLVGDH
jgi:hypothetical protein